MSFSVERFAELLLGDGNRILVGNVPPELTWNEYDFESHWNAQPQVRHRIQMYGHWFETPRGQQAHGADYAYTGSKNNALPIPDSLFPLLSFVKAAVCSDLNGLLINYYNGPEDYIGPHHDSLKGLLPGSPIVTMSFGEERVFRLEQGKGAAKKTIDLAAPHGTVFVMPWETNKAWKHSVPKKARYYSRRISVTIRAFTEGLVQSPTQSTSLELG